jgi:hypothetical protein
MDYPNYRRHNFIDLRWKEGKEGKEGKKEDRKERRKEGRKGEREGSL